MENNPTIFIRPHLGLGDMLVSNAIFRHFAETHNVKILCKLHNLPSVQFMLRDVKGKIIPVGYDAQASSLADLSEKRGDRVLRLGMFGKGFDEKRWSECMYEQAGIPFEKRWTDWKVERDLSREFEPPTEPYAFVHEDPKRGFILDRARVPMSIKIVCPYPGVTDNIFEYCRLIENATEIHVIDSCFAILADSLPNLKAKRKVVHIYARPNALPPTYQTGWEILR